MSNSRAAINLLENFLNGEGFECYECKYKDVECNVNRYEQITLFLRSKKEKDISYPQTIMEEKTLLIRFK